MSIGIDEYKHLDTDNGDNGVYIIENWQIIAREYYSGYEQNTHDLFEMVTAINKAQPESEQICITKELVELE